MLVTIIKDVYLYYPVGSVHEVRHVIPDFEEFKEHFVTEDGFIFYPDEIETYHPTDIKV